MRTLYLIVCLCIFTSIVSAQENFKWNNLELDKTSIDETIKLFGKPKKDEIVRAKTDKSDFSALVLRKLQFNKIEEYEKVILVFQNEKLVGMELFPKKKKIFAAELLKTYKIDFLFLEGIPKGMKFGDFEGQKETTVPKVYPVSYFMLSAQKNYIVIASIDNDSWKAVWRDTVKKPTIEIYPGFVRTIQIYSKEPEKK
ncbi:MAG TPA: hypothetical protein PKY59_17340 [Pyrinomonadaceae bacterium]|nr:hypothetical protein [Pyrinomonadaceae bacterium]